jgi:hypothetical protein
MPVGLTAELSLYTSAVSYASAPRFAKETPPAQPVRLLEPQLGAGCIYTDEGQLCCPQPDGSVKCTTPSPPFPCSEFEVRCVENGPCINLQTDQGNCGRCGNVCGSGQVCCAGTCITCPRGGICSGTSCGCPFGMIDCGGTCVICEGGTCCDNSCVYLSTDLNNCGGCGNVCGPGQICCAGTCVTCPRGGICSGTSCIGCPGDQIDSDGICCPTGMINCAGACTEIATDRNNCGSCGTTCAVGEQCCNGRCTSTACAANQWWSATACQCFCSYVSCGDTCCPQGQECCGGNCTDISNDNNNCGQCGLVCGPNRTCENGSCVCSYQPCQTTCCAQGEACCGGTCCPSSQTCCSGTCCSPDQATCFNGCCVTNSPPLTSNNNYLLFNGCNPILDLSVTLQVTEDLVATNGFSFQLNAYNPAGPTTSWMQYVIMMNGTGFAARIEYWQIDPDNITFPGNTNLFGIIIPSSPTSIPGINVSQGNTVPAGYSFNIQLQQNTTGSITGATFTIFDNMGNSFPLFLPVSDSNFFFPIVAFQTNLVGYVTCGPFNPFGWACPAGPSTTFTSGAGTITYEAQSLCVEGGLPEICANSTAAQDTITNESSNIIYQPIGNGACCGTQIQQLFSASSL